MRQNIFLEVKDTKTFTLIESNMCGEKKCATWPTRLCQNELESIVSVDILSLNSLEFQLWEKPSLENISLPFTHQAIKANKCQINCIGLENREN